jgi:hypothetical protein
VKANGRFENFIFAQINLIGASDILKQKAKNFKQNSQILSYCTSGSKKDRRNFPLKANPKALRSQVCTEVVITKKFLILPKIFLILS